MFPSDLDIINKEELEIPELPELSPSCDAEEDDEPSFPPLLDESSSSTDTIEDDEPSFPPLLDESSSSNNAIVDDEPSFPPLLDESSSSNNPIVDDEPSFPPLSDSKLADPLTTPTETPFSRTINTAKWKAVPDSPSKECNSIPCPADGDEIVFVSDVDNYVKESGLTVQCQGGNIIAQYAVLELNSESLAFVMTKPECPKPIRLSLSNSRPGFDSTSIWIAEDEKKANWLIFVHFPVSGRKPIPDSCTKFLMPCPCLGRLAETFVQAYPLTGIVTLSSWRSTQEVVSAGIVYHLVEQIADKIEEIFATDHALMRISPDTVAIEGNNVRFFGVLSLDQPWNERCALAHRQLEYAAIPPECLGFLRQNMTPEQGVYILGAILFYLISGAKIPTCEAIGYDIALDARAYAPDFPIGWDEIIHRALRPNPETRYPDIPSFMNALNNALTLIHQRLEAHSRLKYDVAVDTHIGITKRLRCPVNQDAVFMRVSESKQRILMVVADGVSTSTYGSGDIASNLLVKKAEEIWDRYSDDIREIDAELLINNILFGANDAICQYIRERYSDMNPTASECMGTTALVAIIENGTLTLGSIGDSRAYMIRSDSMECITRDHNLFTVGIINGLPLEMCVTHPHAGSLVQCLGYYEDSEVSDSLAFDIFKMNLLPGDILMMTTDGILDYIACDLNESELRIAETVRSARNAGLACLELIMQANMGGGGDNCGVGIIRVLDE